MRLRTRSGPSVQGSRPRARARSCSPSRRPTGVGAARRGIGGGTPKGGAAWTRFAFPTWWHYDVLRGLEHLRFAGVAPDERVAEAIDLVASKRDDDGKWLLDTQHLGRMPIETDEGEGRPSRWITLRALRVLEWHSGGAQRS
jgi:hypothetical protein